MNFTYIDNGDKYVVVVDGVAAEMPKPSPSVDQDIHAIQGFGDVFEIEYKNDPQNKVFNTKPPFIDKLLDEWSDGLKLKERQDLEEDMTLDERLAEGFITQSEYEVLAEEEYQIWLKTCTVSKFQAKVALYKMNLLSTVQAHMETVDDISKMAWADAQIFKRSSPTMKALAVELGLSDTQLDDLFRLAETIEA